MLAAQGSALSLLSFNYGQRHQVELEHAANIACLLSSPHQTIDITGLAAVMTGSSLTDRTVPVPDGHYTDESVRATVVPNRNAIMLDIAVAAAVARKADAVAFGAHAGDHTIYPDCRPEFVELFSSTARRANAGLLSENFTVLAPFLKQSKTDIVRIGVALGVPFEHTWSCYRGGDLHCGTCGTCTERREAFQHSGFADPTVYATL
jgi:7-cyano-7-deazaguanine synthase